MCEWTIIDGRALRFTLCLCDRGTQCVEVVDVGDVLDMPALRLEAQRAVLAEGDRRSCRRS